MPSETFLLAHLSDVHLAPMPRLPLSALNLKRALGAANWYRHRRHVHVREVLDALVADLKAQSPGHIAVTGDLVNLGLPGEHAAALQWLQALGSPEHVSVVPGNHDAYVHLRSDPGYRRWQAYMQGDDPRDNAENRRAGILFPYVRRRGPAALIAVGSGVPTRPFVSAGHLGEAQREALRGHLAEAEQHGLVRIVAIHHPPHRYPQEWRTGLRDADALDTLLRLTGADMVLHGHFHKAQVRWIEGPGRRVPLIGAPSASAAIRHKGGDLAGYNLYRITAGGGAGRHRIEMIRRGLAEPGGRIVELERTLISG